MTSRRRRRIWVFRLAAVGLGFSAFAILEIACRLAGLAAEDATVDPFVGFSHVQPLFELNATGDRYEIAPARRKFFAEDGFAVRKPAGTFRIFCLGGSTVQGRPYSLATSFTTWLKIALQQSAPGTHWEVVNCGGISYASYRLVPIMQECLTYEPDLFIIATGHNEFLEDRSYGAIRDNANWVTVLHRPLCGLRSYQLLRRGMQSMTVQQNPPPDILGPEVDALLDYNEGLRAYRRAPQWRAGVIRHYESNLDRIASLARKHAIPLLFIRPPSNLADSPPFKSEHRAELSSAELQRFEMLMRAVRQKSALEPLRSAALLEEARDIDPEFAVVRYYLGKVYESLGRYDEARIEFLAAREHDICPLRMLQPMEAALQQLARRRSLPLLDAHRLLEMRTQHRILDGSQLVDHVHPSIEGHQVIALAVFAQLSKMGVCAPAADRQGAVEAAFEEHLNSLPPLYFAKGEQTLQNLRAWSQGRADGPHISTRNSH